MAKKKVAKKTTKKVAKKVYYNVIALMRGEGITLAEAMKRKDEVKNSI